MKEIFERTIVLAADNVGKLREPDVMRVMQEYFLEHKRIDDFADYIISNRPDLVSETKACQSELLQCWTCKTAVGSIRDMGAISPIWCDDCFKSMLDELRIVQGEPLL